MFAAGITSSDANRFRRGTGVEYNWTGLLQATFREGGLLLDPRA